MVWTMYEVIGSSDLEYISKKLHKRLGSKTVLNAEGDNVELRSAISNVKLMGNKIRGLFRYEELNVTKDWDNKIISKPITKTVDFTFIAGSTHLLISASYTESEKFVNVLKRIMPEHNVIHKSIMSTKLDNFLYKNHCDLYYCSWKELDISNLSTSSIAGNTLKNSSEFKYYSKHGIKNSIIFQCAKINETIQITKRGTVSFRTNPDRNTLEKIIECDVFPLCQ